MKKPKIAYNKSFADFVGIPKYNSDSQMFTNLNIPSFAEIIMKYALIICI